MGSAQGPTTRLARQGVFLLSAVDVNAEMRQIRLGRLPPSKIKDFCHPPPGGGLNGICARRDDTARAAGSFFLANTPWATPPVKNQRFLPPPSERGAHWDLRKARRHGSRGGELFLGKYALGDSPRQKSKIFATPLREGGSMGSVQGATTRLARRGINTAPAGHGYTGPGFPTERRLFYVCG